MYGIIIKDFVEENDMKNALHDFFKELPVSIAYFDIEKNSQNEDLKFEYNPMQGDFAFELCLYTSISFSIEELSLSICRAFKTQAVISDDSVNPYTWILLNESGKIGVVEQVVREDDLFQIKNAINS